MSKIPREGQSLKSMKLVGLALGLVPLLAGIVDGSMIPVWHSVWVEFHRRSARFGPPKDPLTLLFFAFSLTLIGILLSLGSWALSGTATDLNLGMSGNAWRVLFAGCGLAGFAIATLA